LILNDSTVVIHIKLIRCETALLLDDRKQLKARELTQLTVRDAADQKRYCTCSILLYERPRLLSMLTTHFLYLSNINTAMSKSFKKTLLKCVVLTYTVRLFYRHCLQHPRR